MRHLVNTGFLSHRGCQAVRKTRRSPGCWLVSGSVLELSQVFELQELTDRKSSPVSRPTT